VLATGRFRWLGAERVEPLLRAEPGQASAGAWAAARDTWEIAPPEFGGFSSVAVGPAGELALATTGITPQIWLDGGSGLEAIAQLNAASDAFDFVRSMAWYDGALWVAGWFTLTNGVSNLAVWDGVEWTQAPNGIIDGPVYDLLVDGETLYVAGGFEDIGGIAASRVASWNGTAWTALDMTLAQTGPVYALAMSPEGELVAGGTFSDEADTDCPTTGSVARWNGAAWEMLGAGVSAPDFACGGSRAGLVYDLTFHQGDLYVTGVFTHANGAVTSAEAVPANTFARYVGGQWESLDGGAPTGVLGPWVFFGTEGFGIVGQRLFSDGDRLLAGILTPGAGGVASPGLIAYQGGQWVAQGPPARLGLHGDSGKLAVGGPDCALHAVGNMTHTEGQPLTSPVLRFDGDGWVPVGAAVPENLSCGDAMAVDPAGTTFLACEEKDGSGSEVLTSDGGAWTSLGTPDAPGRVRAMAVDPRGVVWAVGGAVSDGGNPSSGFVSRLHDGAWAMIAVADREVTHIDFAPEGGDGPLPAFVVGGGFNELASQPFAKVAHFDGVGWVALGGGLQRPVGALEYGRHAIYASEQADGVNDVLDVGRWDRSAWEELATTEHEFPQVVSSSVTRLIEVGDTLVVAGSFWRGEFPPQERMVLRFDGTRFDWLAGGVAANFLSDAAVTAEGLWFAGAIAEAGVGADRVSTVGIARLGWSR
jgi:hypothetical protein